MPDNSRLVLDRHELAVNLYLLDLNIIIRLDIGQAAIREYDSNDSHWPLTVRRLVALSPCYCVGMDI